MEVIENKELGKTLHHYIVGNIYYLVDSDMNILLTIELTPERDQIILTTEKVVFSGPVSFLDID